MKTNLPIQKFGITKDVAKNMKKDALYRKTPVSIGIGVNDTSEDKEEASRIINQGTDEEKLNCKFLRFKHTTPYCIIQNTNIGKRSVRVTYDGVGNILIGMDILKDWDIHIGRSKITSKTTFIACPYDMINNEYFKALNEHFGL